MGGEGWTVAKFGQCAELVRDTVPHPISWTVFLIIIMQQPQGQAASDEPAAGIGS